ncbi:hypothetical protein FNF29_08306 [Cafeteria roenbergensis]|uniref:Uncharacterized protein n=1 Tax=Cafeteria roenbergensis TaxID=33653 RepID=A0A5A8BYW7_CAFRO|nr:hypothetical protein FNF29_08306 [Cafeteria roenbergensis]|eukprot:KAA0145992.1 hypothetical protein FNF29_08306 [Cafeteria roenbergensis]
MATPAMDGNALASGLWEAAKAGSTAEAGRLLDEGAPVNWKNAAAHGRTALIMAAWRCRRDMAELLLDRGADLEAKDRVSRARLLF